MSVANPKIRNPKELPGQWRKEAKEEAKPKKYGASSGILINTLRRCARELTTALRRQDRQCVHCGCTDSRACPGGCSWAIKHKATHTGVCSQCIEKEMNAVSKLNPWESF